MTATYPEGLVTITFDDKVVSEESILAAIRKMGFTAKEATQ